MKKAPFYDVLACESKIHCPSCLTSPTLRKQSRAPDTCPYDITLDALPPAQHTIQHTERDERYEECKACGNMECGLKPLSDCKRKRKITDGFDCPEGLF